MFFETYFSKNMFRNISFSNKFVQSTTSHEIERNTQGIFLTPVAISHFRLRANFLLQISKKIIFFRFFFEKLFWPQPPLRLPPLRQRLLLRPRRPPLRLQTPPQRRPPLRTQISANFFETPLHFIPKCSKDETPHFSLACHESKH